MSAAPANWRIAENIRLVMKRRARAITWPLAAGALSPLPILMAMPVAWFLLTLTCMLFRPPGVEFYGIDRVVFVVTFLILLLRSLLLRKSLRFANGLFWPMAGLVGLATADALSHSFDAITWSVLVAKFVTPFGFFWLAGLVFDDDRSIQWLERFYFVVLAYLIYVSVAFLAEWRDLIVPRFILDDSIGIHTDRARGPFVQAVANGVALNFLGLLAIEGYRRGRLRGAGACFLLASLPVAIVATKTRAVWFAAAISIGWLTMRTADRKLRQTCLGCAIAAVIAILLVSNFQSASLGSRFADAGPVEFRMAVYHAAWEMFEERPAAGWGTYELQTELASRTNGFQGANFAVHNTYLEMLLEYGIVGLSLYVWIVIGLLRLHKRVAGESPAVASIRCLWPLLLGVYLFNATFVVMNYAFVNGVLFTYAGILAASRERTERSSEILVAASSQKGSIAH